MKKYSFLPVLLLFCFTVFSQVGINTTTPNAQLDIKSSNQATPSNTDGILIPKIDVFPVTNPTAAQIGMMVYLTTASGGNQPGFYYWDSAWKKIGSGAGGGWELTGNAGTIDGTHFVGTTDNVPLNFKVNNQKAGRVDDTGTVFLGYQAGNVNTGLWNTGIGHQALLLNSVGEENVAVGNIALYSNTTGYGNNATGSGALFNNTEGNYNVANGRSSLYSNTTGSFNTANGVNTLQFNTTGESNVANGTGALFNNETGNRNTANGAYSLSSNTTGNDNVANGFNALQSNTTGNYNTANGMNVLQFNTTGEGNTANGHSSLFSNINGNYNVANGYNSLFSNTYGIANTANGYNSLYFNTEGMHNTANGAYALSYNTTGNSNTANGVGALNFNSEGNHNVANGYYALFLNTTGNFNVANGAGALSNNTIGAENVAFGFNALSLNMVGSKAVAIGSYAMEMAYDSSTAFDSKNVAVGYEALHGSPNSFNNSGNDNTAVGYQALRSVATGGANTAIGSSAMLNNAEGVSNTVVGQGALFTNIDGGANTAVGNDALRLANGYYNAALGFSAMAQLNSGSENTAIGAGAMGFQTSGNYNIAIGRNSSLPLTTGSNQMSIGNVIYGADMTSAATGKIGIGVLTPTEKLEVAGKTKTTSLQVTTSPSAGYVLTSDASGNATWQANSGIDADFYEVGGTLPPNAITDNMYHTGNVSIGTNVNNNLYKLYTSNIQLTATGDGQSTIYGYRSRDSQNDGIGYSAAGTNKAVSGYNLWGDIYAFGVAGHSDNDFTRTGGVLGAVTGGTYWSSLGYKNSGSTTYGVYATAALGSGTGRMAQSSEHGIGGGFYGGIIGSWSKGSVIGQVSSGSLFASYNSGDEYTAGRQVEIVATATGKKAAYTVTSTEAVVYKKGKITLVNGTARVTFDSDYAALLGDAPVVTTSPMGECNGIYIESIDKNGFTVKELNKGTSNVQVTWIAVGDRIDAKQSVSQDVLSNDFDNNINEVMFNENNKENNAKAMWSNGDKINFGKLPKKLIAKPIKTEK